MPAGRPPTIEDPAVQEIILEAIRAGNYRQTAVAAAGMHRNSLYHWEKRAEEGVEPYASFMARMSIEEAKAEIALLAEIRSAQAAVVGVSGADVWTAKAWILERRFPQRFCARVKQTVAEQVDMMTSQLRRDPELHRKVLDVLDQEPAPAGSSSH
jgi:hypothetical protein